MVEQGAQVDLHLRTPEGGWVWTAATPEAPGRETRRGLSTALIGYDAVVIQYQPYLYGPWGFAPWLPIELWRLRRLPSRPRIALMAHEMYVAMKGGAGGDPGAGASRRFKWRRELQGVWQRFQLHAMRVNSDVVFTSVEAWANRLRNSRPMRPAHYLPVGSNLPDMREARARVRQLLAIEEETVVLVTRGSHSHYVQDDIVMSANAVAAAFGRALLLVLGADVQVPSGLDARVITHSTGSVALESLASYLAAGDIFLGAFIDGVSTRRTMLMATLQHGVAVVGTDGVWTDRILRQSPGAIRLVPVKRGDRFVQEVVRLAGSRAERQSLGQEGRLLYERAFDWPVLTRRLLAAMQLA
jgi:glycosyltransferase involved in cell wall biosynthesis